ncbi:monocarboxylate transporter 12-like [Dermacentor silvarum]|uniref:monocarboxylate transporter 12-like n=1 Tax=Dermacentor silvarum TaxID=543639 RepID=UPI00189BBEC6|nr:monocarboxylate transporter 12-like [Dermacentor silvarum]XP_049519323.1 monocarboxylate transporter 12-like [Dermacentor silvarum]XP_049519324.1 monocarboxylate transporter 12-like [Dermacentor silvarum]
MVADSSELAVPNQCLSFCGDSDLRPRRPSLQAGLSECAGVGKRVEPTTKLPKWKLTRPAVLLQAGAARSSTAAAPGSRNLEKWVIGAACVATTFMTGATLRTIGFLFVNFLGQFGATRQQTAWSVSFTSAGVAFSGVLCKFLLRWSPPWPLIMIGSACQLAGMFGAYCATNVTVLAVTFGLLHGIGAGLVFVLTGTFIERTFVTKRRLVMQLNMVAFCSAGSFFPRILLYIAQEFGYSWMMLFLAGVLLNVPVLCVLFRPRRKLEENNNVLPSKAAQKIFSVEQGTKLSSSESVGDPVPESIFAKPLFYVTALTHLIFFYVINLFASISVDTILSKGIPVIFAITIAPSVSVLDCIGRVVMPLATEKGYVKRSTLVMMDYFFIGVGFVLISLIRSYPAMLATCLGFGVFSGHAIAVHNSLMGDVVGAEQLNLSNVIVTCIATVSFLTKPLLFGFFRDMQGSYDNLYRLMSGLMFLNALVWLVVNLTERFRKKRKWTTSSSELQLCDLPTLTGYQVMDLTSLMA